MDNEEKITKLIAENAKLKVELQTIKERIEIYNSQPSDCSSSREYFIQNKEDCIRLTRRRQASIKYHARRRTYKVDSKPTPAQKKECFWIFFCCKKREN